MDDLGLLYQQQYAKVIIIFGYALVITSTQNDVKQVPIHA